MKRFCKYIVSCFLCFAMLFSMISGSYASGDLVPAGGQDVSLDDAASFWQWIQGDSGVGFTTYWDALWSFDSEGCTASPDGMHFWNCSDPTVGLISNSFIVKCSYCGLNYREYLGKEAGPLTNDDFVTAHDSFVEEFPAHGYNSAGHLMWQPTVDDIILSNGGSGTRVNGYHLTSIPIKVGYNEISSGPGGLNVVYTAGSNSTHTVSFYLYFTPPVAGSYRPTSKYCDIYCVPRSGSPFRSSYKHKDGISFERVALGSSLEFTSADYDTLYLGDNSYCEVFLYHPVYEVIPDVAPSGDTYAPTTRPTSITGGNYGIVGDDGTINNVTTNNQIINETNNTYYNPATGETSTIKDWSYNYEDRSYTLTLENGDTTTVTYGDENISITENNQVATGTTVNNYTIYYMVDKPADPGPSASQDPSPSPSPSPSGCDHDWKETSRTDPTCISSGSVSYTCSKCGETKTETLKAKGHDWKVERTVQTTYDEEGNLIQQGYTIYKCSVCGEQYKDEQSTGPPGGTTSDDVSGIMAIVTAIFDELPKLFQRFLDFLAVVFPYLPPEITLLLTFGVVAVVFIGIIKAIRR